MKKRQAPLKPPVTERKVKPPPREPEPPPTLRPKNVNQGAYLTALETQPQIFALGPAGTGKTFLAASWAADALREGRIARLILTRPAVPVGEDLGFLPGSLEEKIAPWARPFTDILEQRMGRSAFYTALRERVIEIMPIGMMRGSSFDKTMVVCDEAQNTSVMQIKMLLTRIGEESKVVLLGDLKQSDLDEEDCSGLEAAMWIAKAGKLDVTVIEFGLDDIVRSGVCAMWAEAFERAEAGTLVQEEGEVDETVVSFSKYFFRPKNEEAKF
jgi:phosphate starvation-inducible PhoH-like protein